MEAYTGFAQVYDTFMDNIPYKQWAVYLTALLEEYGVKDGLVLELGCGTGSMTRLLAGRGYDMIAVDNSEEMLMIAREKSMEDPGGILYLLQDMRSFELYGTVRAVVSICDSMNYITQPEDLCQVFKLVNNYLDPGGIFIFDFNTEHEYRDLTGQQVIAEDREEVSFIWYNDYDEEHHLNYIDLSVFVQEKEDLYRKFQEQHIQRGYTLPQIRELLEQAGLVFADAFDGYSREAAREDSARVVVVAREHGKESVRRT